MRKIVLGAILATMMSMIWPLFHMGGTTDPTTSLKSPLGVIQAVTPVGETCMLTVGVDGYNYSIPGDLSCDKYHVGQSITETTK